MPAITATPMMLSVASGSATQADNFGNLKKCVARFIGGESQSAVLDEAGRGIIRGIHDINMRHLFEFGSEKQSDAALVATDPTYALPNDVFGVREIQLIDSDSAVYRTLDYLEWGDFNRRVAQQDDTGTPTIWTVQNSFDDLEVHVYPVPDASAAADYTLRIFNYTRIAAPSSDGDVIVAPIELNDVLCTYGEYHISMWDNKTNVAVWDHKLRHYKDKLMAFKGMDARHDNKEQGWGLAYSTGSMGRTDQFDPLG